MNDLLIRNARIIDPTQKLDRLGEVLVKGGVIFGIGDGFSAPDGAETVDAAGLCLTAGLVDMHVHLRDPGFTHKEDILSGCAAAAAGGFTTLACMPNTNPVCDNPDVVKYIVARAKTAKARVYPIAAITQELKSIELTDFERLRQAGAVGISDDGRPVTNNALMLEAMRRAAADGLCVISHAEDLDVTDGGIINRGEVSERLGVRGIDRASEDCATAAVIALAESTGARIHIAHVSTRGSVAIIRDAKRRGAKVTAETAPHYFTLTDQSLLLRDANFRMSPPLREESDRLAVLAGIADGTLDCIATDHAPHTAYEKAEFETAPNGVVGLETSLALALTKLVHTGLITLPRLVEMMSVSPAKILGVRAGTLQEGAPADLTLFDPDKEWVIDAEAFHSKARNTCFGGMRVKGRVCRTFLGGAESYRDG